MKLLRTTFLAAIILCFGSLATADLVLIDTDSDGLVGTPSSFTFQQTQTIDGVTFTASFDLTAKGGVLSNAGSTSNDAIAVFSVGESAGRADDVNSGEGFTVNNFSISNVSGGTAVFNGVTRVGIRNAAGADDEGTFTVGADTFDWSDFNPADGFEDLDDLDGFGGDNYELNNAFVAGGGLSNSISAFDLDNTGTGSSIWVLDAVEFDVITAVPEPTSVVLFGLAMGGLGFRRRRAQRKFSDLIKLN